MAAHDEFLNLLTAAYAIKLQQASLHSLTASEYTRSLLNLGIAYLEEGLSEQWLALELGRSGSEYR